MKLILTCCGALIAAATLSAQSPAATESKVIGGKKITIGYSSPRVNGRVGKLFGKDGAIGGDATYPIWRGGANEATKLTTEANLAIGSLNVPAGSYSLYVDITNPDDWQLIVNKQTGQSGMTYDKAQELGRVKMTMSKPSAPIENLKYTLTSQSGANGKLTLEWENHIASVPIAVK